MLVLALGLAFSGCASPPEPLPPPPPPRTAAVPDLADDLPRSEKTMLEALWDAEKTRRAQAERIAELEREVARLERRLRERDGRDGIDRG
jgi:hypothetical protein